MSRRSARFVNRFPIHWAARLVDVRRAVAPGGCTRVRGHRTDTAQGLPADTDQLDRLLDDAVAANAPTSDPVAIALGEVQQPRMPESQLKADRPLPR